MDMERRIETHSEKQYPLAPPNVALVRNRGTLKKTQRHTKGHRHRTTQYDMLWASYFRKLIF